MVWKWEVRPANTVQMDENAPLFFSELSGKGISVRLGFCVGAFCHTRMPLSGIQRFVSSEIPAKACSRTLNAGNMRE
ncbi:MAG: hypothetical protein D8M57_15050 [Candidatus Scalindua sp. AMX11]|nr:MAG: hypothetical protein DWQ00_09215 [Candidatus Scalindua sp.]TDE64051.1 MAG: hypothetical protein D8M57_15050 [Candidatus Scalindua sp. AMX11]